MLTTGSCIMAMQCWRKNVRNTLWMCFKKNILQSHQMFVRISICIYLSSKPLNTKLDQQRMIISKNQEPRASLRPPKDIWFRNPKCTLGIFQLSLHNGSIRLNYAEINKISQVRRRYKGLKGMKPEEDFPLQLCFCTSDCGRCSAAVVTIQQLQQP